ncbi:MFS transporter cpaT [Fulvia fulva]|nr:MFS transporter cpaT [Fulvia fulva]WPV26166.1 MFS transporter cpaT [Fulvia fulva]
MGCKSEDHSPSPSSPQSPANTNAMSTSSLEEKPTNVLTLAPNDKADPRNWSNQKKWLIAGISLLGTFILPLNGTGITIAVAQITVEFNVLDTAHFTNSYWIVTSWSIGGAVFVIFFLSLLEDIGVRIGYHAFYFFFLMMMIPQAVAPNFATLVITRFFSGGCVALLANTIASIIPDLWDNEEERSLPVSLYIILYVAGSTAGPVIFAGIVEATNNWRWVFYAQLIIYCAFFPFFLYFIKETRGHVILRRRAKKLRKAGKQIWTREEIDAQPLLTTVWTSITRPLYLLLTEPVLAASTLWSAFAFGTVFFFTQSVEQVFKSLYGWTAYQCGYVQAAVVIGEVVGWMISQYGTKLYLQSAKRNKECPGTPIPEARLYVAIPGSLFGIAGGMFVYAWTSYPNYPWIAPAIGLCMVGLGIQIVVSAVADYITDAYAKSGYAGSAISAVAMGENIVAGFLPLAEASTYTNLGFQWASTLLACLGLLVTLAPVVFVLYGPKLRENSPFMQSGGALKEEAEPSTSA